jgi:hypothetical protein
MRTMLASLGLWAFGQVTSLNFSILLCKRKRTTYITFLRTTERIKWNYVGNAPGSVECCAGRRCYSKIQESEQTIPRNSKHWSSLWFKALNGQLKWRVTAFVSMAAGTNFHKPGNLIQRKCITSVLWIRSPGWLSSFFQWVFQVWN